MSWKGFTKAVARLPQMVMAKAGYSDETVDPEFNELEERFKAFETEAKKLHEDAKKFKDALSCLLAHQASFAATLHEVYQTIGPQGSRRTSQSSVAAGGDGAVGRSVRSLDRETPEEALVAAEQYARITAVARESLLPDLDILERRLVLPTAELMALIEKVKRFIVKRAHKLLDHDRHRDSVKKMREKQDRSISDERTLGKYEANLDQAAREYNAINNLLKQQIPVLLSLKAPFMDPCFLTLYWYQLRVARTLADGSRELMSNPYFRQNGATLKPPTNDEFAVHIEAQATLLKDLTLVARNKARTSLEMDQGYYTASSAETSPNDGKPPGPVEYPNPLNAGAAAPASSATRPSFGSMHYNNAPGAASPAYPNPLNAAAASPAYPNPLNAASASSSAAPPAYGSAKSYVIALYDFEAQAEGDLSFRRDDKIEVVEKSEDPNDWWTGTLNGKTGTFPANYVALI
ncbi:hypothetical protein HDU96_001747 [Phlyctochytrium bullatum]|nr:hypothetical protein HDU96_001747 [Phlyctochytrium bullatum]